LIKFTQLASSEVKQPAGRRDYSRRLARLVPLDEPQQLEPPMRMIGEFFAIRGNGCVTGAGKAAEGHCPPQSAMRAWRAS
jgi:hypothetical protein